MYDGRPAARAVRGWGGNGAGLTAPALEQVREQECNAKNLSALEPKFAFV